jgi:hypothetical protein
MASLGLLASPTPYHILAYGTLLGTEVFQSFIAGVQAYRVLPRPQFSTLQSALFPIYFSMQTTLPVVLALTFPGSTHGTQISSTTSTTSWGVSHTAGGLAGIFEPTNRWPVLIPLATIFITSLVNLVYVGPTTTKVMKERKHQETRDGKKSYDDPPQSTEMQALNRRFATMHGISSLLNMVGCVATVSYGFYLAGRID